MLIKLPAIFAVVFLLLLLLLSCLLLFSLFLLLLTHAKLMLRIRTATAVAPLARFCIRIRVRVAAPSLRCTALRPIALSCALRALINKCRDVAFEVSVIMRSINRKKF